MGNVMDKTTMGMFAPNLVALCIDKRLDADYNGKVYDQYHEEPVRFRGMLDALRCVEFYLDRMDFPQRSTVQRTFRKQAIVLDDYGKRPVREEIMSNLENKKGEEGTFIVQVKYRQNATWQGQVVWAEKNKKMYFRSALELLRLIDDAMQSEEGTSGDTETTEETT